MVREAKVDWAFVPIQGSYATVDQMRQAVEILADPARQPIFYHCVAGHHRSSQVQAAYRIARQGWSASRAWSEVAALPWARPATDREDRRLIEAFALANPPKPKEPPGPPADPGPLDGPGIRRRLAAPGLR